MDQQILLKLCLNSTFYNTNKHKILDTYFDSKLKPVWETLKKWHDKFNRDVSVEELKLYFETESPLINATLKDILLVVINELKGVETVGQDLGNEVLTKLHKAEVARQIAEYASKIIAGDETSFLKITKLLETEQEDTEEDKEELQAVSTTLDDILTGISINTKWEFNIPSLKSRVPGIGPGIFTLVFARPECGKTAFWVSMVAGRDGFADQGAVVHAIINEEPAIRTMGRCVTSYVQNNMDWIRENKEEAAELFGEVKDRIKLYDSVGMSLDKLEAHVRFHRPDVLVVDQIDKLSVDGSYARDDQRLRAVYIGIREIAKKYDTAIVGISQASADADGQSRLNFTWLENSRTGKAAECDIVIGVGHNPAFNADNIRGLTLCKNKVSGNHDFWHVCLEADKSVYRD